MNESFGPARGYRLLIASGSGEQFRPQDVVGMPADAFGPGYIPLFTRMDLIPEWVGFLTMDIKIALETATLASRDVLTVMQAYGATHVSIDPRPENPGRLIPVADFIAGLT
jgi:hypothetical protein